MRLDQHNSINISDLTMLIINCLIQTTRFTKSKSNSRSVFGNIIIMLIADVGMDVLFGLKGLEHRHQRANAHSCFNTQVCKLIAG